MALGPAPVLLASGSVLPASGRVAASCEKNFFCRRDRDPALHATPAGTHVLLTFFFFSSPRRTAQGSFSLACSPRSTHLAPRASSAPSGPRLAPCAVCSSTLSLRTCTPCPLAGHALPAAQAVPRSAGWWAACHRLSLHRRRWLACVATPSSAG